MVNVLLFIYNGALCIFSELFHFLSLPPAVASLVACLLLDTQLPQESLPPKQEKEVFSLQTKEKLWEGQVSVVFSPFSSISFYLDFPRSCIPPLPGELMTLFFLPRNLPKSFQSRCDPLWWSRANMFPRRIPPTNITVRVHVHVVIA